MNVADTAEFSLSVSKFPPEATLEFRGFDDKFYTTQPSFFSFFAFLVFGFLPTLTSLLIICILNYSQLPYDICIMVVALYVASISPDL